MQTLISKLRQACHDERGKNREATEVQMLALELCAAVEKEYLNNRKGICKSCKIWNQCFGDTKKNVRIVDDPEPMKDESHSKARY